MPEQAPHAVEPLGKPSMETKYKVAKIVNGGGGGGQSEFS